MLITDWPNIFTEGGGDAKAEIERRLKLDRERFLEVEKFWIRFWEKIAVTRRGREWYNVSGINFYF